MSRVLKRLPFNCFDSVKGIAGLVNCELFSGNARASSSVPLPDFDYKPPPYTGPSRDEVISMRKQYVNPGVIVLLRKSWWRTHVSDLDLLSFERFLNGNPRRLEHAGIFHHFKNPVMIVDGKMQYLFDEKGHRYLDVRYVLLCTTGLH